MKQRMNSVCLALVLSLPVAVATSLVGCAPDKPSERTAGEVVDDKALSVRVETVLHGNEEYKLGDVNVTSFRDTVQLSGFVNTADQKQKAGELAAKVEGVKTVENNITVKDKIN